MATINASIAAIPARQLLSSPASLTSLESERTINHFQIDGEGRPDKNGRGKGHGSHFMLRSLRREPWADCGCQGLRNPFQNRQQASLPGDQYQPHYSSGGENIEGRV